jgi:hypothetical protein
MPDHSRHRVVTAAYGQPGFVGGAAWADSHQGDPHQIVAFS